MNKLHRKLAILLFDTCKAFNLDMKAIEYGKDTETDTFLKWNLTHKGHSFSLKIDKKTEDVKLIY